MVIQDKAGQEVQLSRHLLMAELFQVKPRLLLTRL
jgi:hypothetical protein